MKPLKKVMILFILSNIVLTAQKSWIRINQLGYQNNSIKVAVFVTHDEEIAFENFEIINAVDGEAVYMSSNVKSYGSYGSFKKTYRLDFSEVHINGRFFVLANGIKSPEFRIGNDVYDGTVDFILKYMRQQRCGYNPFLKDSCHTQDGFIVDRPELDSTYINVKGGWHDATDYLQYLTTSANATYQLLFAYLKNPEVFKDEFNESGDKEENGIPDILDEAKWGLDWLVKMNPEYGVMFNQIADDRDHAGYRLPTKDSVNYGKGLERPVYFITGKQQGLAKYKNRSTGVSSSAAKFASAFALGSELLKKYYPEFAERIKDKAEEAYKFSLTDLGVTQTACNVSPHFYEEDNYVDDMELAAAQLYHTTKEKRYLDDANSWGNIEHVTPWMGADTARHYQWYPFINMGHYLLAVEADNKQSGQFKYYLNKGLQKIYDRGKNNAFLNGIPFIWCSNNLVAAALTQAKLYEELTQNEKYKEMEASLRDWLFGCNPWGTSMIVGLPEDGDYPTHPHSSLLVVENYQTLGGLVDGPVYGNIFNNLIGVQLLEDDEYKQFQSDLVVYHDDIGDYSTNEPTMDGTASLSFYLSSLEAQGKLEAEKKK
jgi:hypothetical protein